MNYTNNKRKEVHKNYALLLLAKIMIGFIFLVNTSNGYGQGNCSNAPYISPNDTSIHVLSADTVVWFKYHATSQYLNLELYPTDSIQDTVNSIEIYSGVCSALTLVKTSVKQFIYVENLVIGNDYYFKFTKHITQNQVVFTMSKSPIIIYAVKTCHDNSQATNCDLVCNGNFEYSSAIPNGISQIALAQPWGSVNDANPDYYNANAPFLAGVPLNSQGNQYSAGLSGDKGYAGFGTYNPNAMYPYNEYIYQELKQAMIPNHTYTVTLKLSLADNSLYATRNVGIFISDYDPFTNYIASGYSVPNGIPGWNVAPINYNPNTTFLFPGYVTDKTNWQMLTFNFTPTTSGYKYITIGRFGNPDVIYTGAGTVQGSYYYVDEVHIAPVMPNLTINANPNPLCIGQTTQLTNNLGVPLDWSANPNCNLSCPNNCVSTAATPNTTTTFTGILTLAPNCTVTATKTVPVVPLPIPSLVGAVNVCANQPTTYTTDPGMSNYTWTVNGGTIQGASNTNTITVIWQNNGSISVNYTNANNCTGSPTTLNVTINTIPSPVISGARSNCNPLADYMIDNYDPNTLYSWSVNSLGTITTSSNSSASVQWSTPIDNYNPGVLTVTANQDGCTSTASVNVYNCCQESSVPLFYDETITPMSPPINPNSTVFINGIVHIGMNLSLNNVTLQMGPFAKIIVDPSFTFTIDNNSVVNGACKFMWDGIYTSDPTATINVSNSTVRDGINGIVSIDNGKIDIRNNTFVQNYKCISLKDYNPAVSPVPLHSAYIIHNSFGSQNIVLKEPYSNIMSFIGIDVNNVNNVKIGDETDITYTNTFESLYCGINAYKAKMTVYNNLFRNFNSTTIGSGIDPMELYRPTAVFSINPKTTPSTLWVYAVIGGDNDKRNRFENCDMGIYTYNQRVSILNNLLEAYTTGIESRDAWNRSEVVYNTIASTNNIYPRTGIKVYNYQPLPVNLKIASNNVNAIVRGIFVSQCMSSLNYAVGVEYNYVKIPENISIYYKYAAAIDVQSCEGIYVHRNYLYRFDPTFIPASFLPVYGINMAQTRSALVKDNYPIQGYEAGINLFGNNNLTQFYCNSMDNCYYGFLFNQDASVTEQGNDNYTTNNRWTGNYDLLYSGNIIQRKMWGLNHLLTPSTFWHIKYNAQGTDYDPEVLYPHQLSNYIIPFLNSQSAEECPIREVLHAKTAEEREELYGKILREEINYTALFETYSDYDKSTLYKILESDTTLRNLGDTGDVKYQTFYNLIKYSNIGKITDFEYKLMNNELAEAKQLNSSLVNTSQVEEYRKIVNDIYLNTFAIGYYTLTQEQVSTLQQIADVTPWEGGDAVYIARYMLNIEQDNVRPAYVVHPHTNPSPDVEQTVTLYPNPAKDEVTLTFAKVPVGSFTFKVYDITGREIINRKLSTKLLTAEVKLANLYKGIYVYKLESDNMAPFTGKLVIE
jgi:hypothetical protein